MEKVQILKFARGLRPWSLVLFYEMLAKGLAGFPVTVELRA
jgi:hypothetical protein